ncbi:glutelin-2-like, partial [Homalodisca vitripennis]|uniref:glutelin-2-like n=1 Tax=Homalodisca vitripennis TaxID=197043 RepID=UPI001EEA0B02
YPVPRPPSPLTPRHPPRITTHPPHRPPTAHQSPPYPRSPPPYPPPTAHPPPTAPHRHPPYHPTPPPHPTHHRPAPTRPPTPTPRHNPLHTKYKLRGLGGQLMKKCNSVPGKRYDARPVGPAVNGIRHGIKADNTHMNPDVFKSSLDQSRCDCGESGSPTFSIKALCRFRLLPCVSREGQSPLVAFRIILACGRSKGPSSLVTVGFVELSWAPMPSEKPFPSLGHKILTDRGAVLKVSLVVQEVPPRYLPGSLPQYVVAV